MEQKATRKMKLRGDTEEYDAIKTKKSRIFNYDSEESEFCPDELDKELEKLEGDQFVQDKIFKSFVNKMKIARVHASLKDALEHHHSLAQNLEVLSGGTFGCPQVCKVLVCHHAEFKIDEQFFVVITGMPSKYFYEEQDRLTVFGYFDRLTRALIVRPLKEKPESFFDLKFVVVSPNIKVKVTSLTAKSDCMRANILRALFSPPSDFSEAGLKGTIQHAVFERVMLAGEKLFESQQRLIVFEELKNQIELIFTLGIEYDKFENDLLAAIASVVAWKEKYLGTAEPIFETSRMRIYLTQILLTEKAFSSDVFGLSGIVDCIFACKVDSIGEYGAVVDSAATFIPFELKTGLKIKDEYESQVLIYNYLMREETGDFDQGFGFVFYSNVDNRLDFVRLDHLRFYNLMQQRNTIVSKTRELKHTFDNVLQYALPPRTCEVFTCTYCEAKDACVTSATLHKTFANQQQLSALVSRSSHSLQSKDSVQQAFVAPESARKPLEVESMDADELDALLEEVENNFISDHRADLVAGVRLPDLEDMFTREEPKFKGFEEVFRELSLAKMEYFARWLDMILVEENYNLKNNALEKADDYSQYATMLDFDSYDELKLYLKDLKADRDLLLKFSHFFQQELEASLFLEKLSKGQSITLKHAKLNITLFCVVKSKTIRKRPIFNNEYFVTVLMVQCKKSHVHDAFRSTSAKINYERITTGWEYYDPVYVFENKMRSNITRLVSEPRQKDLAAIIVDGKPPVFGAEVTEKQMLDLLPGFDLNKNQRECILKSLNTENFNLILGSRY